MFVQFIHDRAEGCRPNEYRIMEVTYTKNKVLHEKMVCKIVGSDAAATRITNAMQRIYGGLNHDGKTPS